MAKVKSRNTTPEIKVRKALHSIGYRFRLHQGNLPGKPDLVLPRYKMAVFVNGCFWHWHGCKRSRMPSSNKVYWNGKIRKNVERDRIHLLKLKSLDWHFHIIWECQIQSDLAQLVDVLKILEDPSCRPKMRPFPRTAEQ